MLRNPFRAPQYLELVAEELEQAKNKYLEHAGLKEYHAAMERMLVQRIERLEREIKESSRE